MRDKLIHTVVITACLVFFSIEALFSKEDNDACK
jgi:hypothetical protein